MNPCEPLEILSIVFIYDKVYVPKKSLVENGNRETATSYMVPCKIKKSCSTPLHNLCNIFLAILQSIIKEKKSSDGIMVKLYELYPLLCNIITFCPENLMEPISHALLAYHPFLSKE